jgi:hypothetical protein
VNQKSAIPCELLVHGSSRDPDYDGGL